MTGYWLQIDVDPRLTQEKRDLIYFLGQFKNTDALIHLIQQRVFGPGECAKIKAFVKRNLKLKKSVCRELALNDGY